MTQSDIKKFIDYFHDTVRIVRRQKAIFVRGKDGKLVARALSIFSRPQLEMLALWFLHYKQKLSPTIGAMLSDAALEELERKIKDPHFWKELDELSGQYYAEPVHRSSPASTPASIVFSDAELSALRAKLQMK